MAQRRMFSNRIGNSAKFLQMPESSQLLYFHMVLRADDDGIVEVYPLMKILGTPNDSFKVLVVKEFITVLNDDQVCVIRNWLEHNNIRADRKVDSIYKDLIPNNVETIEAKPRSDVKDNSRRVGGPSTDGLGKVRLGKVSIDIYMPIYETYKLLINKTSRLTDKGKGKITKRLEIYSPEDLENAMGKFASRAWWMKNNSHRGVAWFFHSDDRIDQFLNLEKEKQADSSFIDLTKT